MKIVAGLPNLQFLGLGFTQVSDRGLKELVALKKLQTLDVYATEVTNEGIDELRKVIPKLQLGL